MPYIETKTTIKATDEQRIKLKEALGKAIELIPGKSEDWLMTSLTDGASMSFRGDTQKACAMVEVDIFGRTERRACDALTEAICKIINEIFGIDTDRIYVKYKGYEIWGYDGFNL